MQLRSQFFPLYWWLMLMILKKKYPSNLRAHILITVADALGLTGSILVALVATGIGLYYAIRQHFTR